jgi:hypothetical protein
MGQNYSAGGELVSKEEYEIYHGIKKAEPKKVVEVKKEEVKSEVNKPVKKVVKKKAVKKSS